MRQAGLHLLRCTDLVPNKPIVPGPSLEELQESLWLAVQRNKRRQKAQIDVSFNWSSSGESQNRLMDDL